MALARWCRHHNLLTDDIRLTLSTADGLAHIDLHEAHDLQDLREFCTVSVLRNALGVACWLTDSRIPLAATELHFAPPPHADSYRVLFDGLCQFKAPHSRLSFDVGYLQLPLRRDEAALQRMLQRALLLTVRPYRRDRLLVEKVRQTLAEHPEHSRVSEAWRDLGEALRDRRGRDVQEAGPARRRPPEEESARRARCVDRGDGLGDLTLRHGRCLPGGRACGRARSRRICCSVRA